MQVFKMTPVTMRWPWLNWPTPARWAVTGLFLLLVNWLLLAPAESFRGIHVVLAQQDKLSHGVIFGVLAAMLRWSLPAAWGRGWRLVGVVFVLLGYGLATECLQPLLPGSGRSFEWLDLLADGVGVALGVLACAGTVCREEMVWGQRKKWITGRGIGVQCVKDRAAEWRAV